MNTYIVWDQHNNIVIRDIVSKMYARICEFMLEEYFKPNRRYNMLKFQEEEGINEEYMKLVMHILRNECCIIAIDEKTNTIYAVALLKWMTKKWRSWIDFLEILNSPKLIELNTFLHHMIINYSREFPKHDFDSMHLFQYHILEEQQRDEVFMWKFFNAINEVGRHMKMPRVTYIATSIRKQRHLDNANYNRLSEIIYAMYVGRHQQRPYAVLRDANETAVVYYEKQLEPLIPFYEMPPFEAEPVKPAVSINVEPEKTAIDARSKSSV